MAGLNTPAGASLSPRQRALSMAAMVTPESSVSAWPQFQLANAAFTNLAAMGFLFAASPP